MQQLQTAHGADAPSFPQLTTVTHLYDFSIAHSQQSFPHQAVHLNTAIPNSEWLFCPSGCAADFEHLCFISFVYKLILSTLTQCLCTPLLDSLTCPPFLIHCGLGCQMTSSSTENGSCLLFSISFSEEKKMEAALSLLHHKRNTYPQPSPGGLQHTCLPHSGTILVPALSGSFPNEDHEKSRAIWKAARPPNFPITEHRNTQEYMKKN